MKKPNSLVLKVKDDGDGIIYYMNKFEFMGKSII